VSPEEALAKAVDKDAFATMLGRATRAGEARPERR
jgi:hypothetical protein